MGNNWYKDAVRLLEKELKAKAKLDGQQFLIDFHIDDIPEDSIDEYVNGAILDFEIYLDKNYSEWFRKDESFGWYFNKKIIKNDDLNLPRNILLLESEISHENLPEYLELHDILSKNKKLIEYEKTSIIKLATFHEKNGTESEKGNYWFEAGKTCKDINYLDKAADFFQKEQKYEQAKISLIHAIEISYEHGAGNAKILYLTTRKKKQVEYIGDSDEISSVFVEENKVKRKMAKGTKWLWMSFYGIISNYGESPLRVASFGLGIIVFMALIYCCLGLSVSGVCESRGFFTSLYFSFVTFTTLGYGDYSPCVGMGRALSSLLAIAGLFFTSFSIATVVRKYSR